MKPSALSRVLVLPALFAVALLLQAGAARAAESATFEVAGFTFTRPADWDSVPVTSSMRKAQLRVPAKEGDAGEITFFHFGPQGGDVASNTKRWLGQFQSKPDAEKIEKKDFGGTPVTLVSTEGTFSSGMPGGPTTPKADYALLGAIIEGPEGSVFVKMTGPQAVVKDAREKFVDFIEKAAKSRK